MKRCAFLTLADRGDFEIDDDHAVAPLAALGWQVEEVPWNEPGRDWARWDAVVLRSAWDWFEAPDAFLRVLSEIDGATRLANPLPVLRWNLSKTYLGDLRAAGVPIVPTHFFDDLASVSLADVAAEFGAAGCGAQELVCKPVVGANGVDTWRLDTGARADEADAARIETARDAFRQRPGMLQPFRTSVLTEGEYSTFWFGGRFSHAIVKRPAAGEFRTQEERGARLARVEASDALLAAGQAALSVAEGLDPRGLLYARVDFVHGDGGAFELMELELLEPSLYLRMDPLAPGRFARALDAWFR